jgi:hypothetical protein
MQVQNARAVLRCVLWYNSWPCVRYIYGRAPKILIPPKEHQHNTHSYQNEFAYLRSYYFQGNVEEPKQSTIANCKADCNGCDDSLTKETCASPEPVGSSCDETAEAYRPFGPYQ